MEDRAPTSASLDPLGHLLGLSAFAITTCFALPTSAIEGNITISEPAFGSTIVLRTRDEFAGAVASIVFRGKEHLDSADHGRLLQSASSFDGLGECFNPTEGGSVLGSGKESTSVLDAARQQGNQLWTKTEMGFWLNPGAPYPNGCGGNHAIQRAVNTDFTSHHVLEKHITVGLPGFPNVIRHEVAFYVPASFKTATFEASTAYLPKEFSRAIYYDIANSKELDPGKRQGEQHFPVILSTPDGAFAMGVYSPQLPQGNNGYGRFDFGVVVKWNCVFRAIDITPQPYRFQCLAVLGTLTEVEDTLSRLDAKFHPAVDQHSPSTPTALEPKESLINSRCRDSSRWPCAIY